MCAFCVIFHLRLINVVCLDVNLCRPLVVKVWKRMKLSSTWPPAWKRSEKTPWRESDKVRNVSYVPGPSISAPTLSSEDPVYLSWYRWSSAALLSGVPKHSSVDSQHYVSAFFKEWLRIYCSIHQSGELMVLSRPLPLPRTKEPSPVGQKREQKQASIVKQGHHISVVLGFM